MSYDVIYVQYWCKDVKIAESDLGKPQYWKTSSSLCNYKFSGVVCDENGVKLKLI